MACPLARVPYSVTPGDLDSHQGSGEHIWGQAQGTSAQEIWFPWNYVVMAMNQCNRQKPEIVSYLTAAGNKTGSSSTNSNANTLDQFLEQGKTNLIDSYYLTLSINHYCLPHEQ